MSWIMVALLFFRFSGVGGPGVRPAIQRLGQTPPVLVVWSNLPFSGGLMMELVFLFFAAGVLGNMTVTRFQGCYVCVHR